MLYYTHVNEDNAVERKALAETDARDLAVIAGSGERVLALLDQPGLSRVFVLDNNPDALFLCALKVEALKSLPCNEYLAFIGVEEASLQWRLRQFEQLAPSLAEPCREYWQAHSQAIAKGVCN